MSITEADLNALLDLSPDVLALLGPIDDETGYDAALDAEEVLGRMVRENGSHPLSGVYRSLLASIVTYEERVYPMPAVGDGAEAEQQKMEEAATRGNRAGEQRHL